MKTLKAIKSISRIKRKIKRRINRSFVAGKRSRLRRNFSCRSYFRRYILPRKKRLFYRTRKSPTYLLHSYQEESQLFYKLRKNIKRLESYLKLKRKDQYKSKYRPLSKRDFFLGKVYLTHRRRNTFITIHGISSKSSFIRQRVLFKTSGGLLGYNGPKRKTLHARQAVAKEAGTFLSTRCLTSVDIVFTSGVGRIFYGLIKALFIAPIYVRHLIIPKRRSHGFKRLKKAKRL